MSETRLSAYDYARLRDWLRQQGYAVSDDETDENLLAMIWQEFEMLDLTTPDYDKPAHYS
jgi:hypothetical protein